MENNVLVNNLNPWPLYFKRATGIGDIMIPAEAKGFPLLSMDEIKTQIQMNNVMFTGTDGMGSHARIQIIDEEQRKEAFGITGTDVKAPVLLDASAVKELLAIRAKGKFHDRLAELVQTDAEKRMLIDLAYENGAENVEAWKIEELKALADTAKIK